MHHTPARDKTKIEQQAQETIVPEILVLLDRRQRLGNPVPQVHRPLLVGRKVFRMEHISRQLVIAIIIATIQRQIHDCFIQGLAAGGGIAGRTGFQ